mmetsp:Transcript_20805/g.67404  ORF Transcript_20805/g.67404 Transcript_20805/m.67404 type:complete len:204 (-) Transcript_20805:304-915(-)
MGRHAEAARRAGGAAWWKPRASRGRVSPGLARAAYRRSRKIAVMIGHSPCMRVGTKAPLPHQGAVTTPTSPSSFWRSVKGARFDLRVSTRIPRLSRRPLFRAPPFAFPLPVPPFDPSYPCSLWGLALHTTDDGRASASHRNPSTVPVDGPWHDPLRAAPARAHVCKARRPPPASETLTPRASPPQRRSPRTSNSRGIARAARL